MLPFQYDLLSRSDCEIRLLLFNQQESNNGLDGTVFYTLEHVSLSAKPEYTALSYTWGDPSKTVQVQING